jgi:hypothetical protein
MPRSPELSASPEELDRAEANLDVPALVRQGICGATLEKFVLACGRVEASEPQAVVPVEDRRAALA